MSQKAFKKLLYFIVLCLVIASLISMALESRNLDSISQLRSAGPVIEINTKKGDFNVNSCKTTVKTVLSEFNIFLGSLDKVVIHADTTLRRGLSNGEVIYIRCLEDQTELRNVLIHEIGHVIDLGYFVAKSKNYESNFDDFGKKIYLDDISALFYSISWDSNSKIRSKVGKNDFVSEYAMSDPFEDFAESVIVYKQYGNYFREIIKSRDSNILQQKYDFIKSNVFKGVEYGGTTYVALASEYYQSNTIYDATKLHQVK